MGVSRAASVADLQKLGRRRMPGFAFNYFEGGAGEEKGIARNEQAFGKYLFRAKRLAGAVTGTKVTLFGREYAQPFGIPPIGMANIAGPRTDLKMASLAQRENIPYVLSTMGTSTIEEIGAAAPDVAWFQLYVSKNDDISADLLKRAWAVGMRVLVLTVDVPHPGRRNRSIRDQFVLPFRYTPRVVSQLVTHPAWSLSMLGHAPVLKNYASYTDTKDVQGVARFVTALNKFGLDWDDFQRARDRWQGTLVIKGVQETDDAAEMIRRGADSIWVSNHGGRQLESARATIDTLAAIKGVAGTKPVLFDSGIRSGEDILKARALGADMTFAGRAFIYGAAAAGPVGIEAAYDILAKETTSGLGQIGCSSIAALDKSWLA